MGELEDAAARYLRMGSWRESREWLSTGWREVTECVEGRCVRGAAAASEKGYHSARVKEWGTYLGIAAPRKLQT